MIITPYITDYSKSFIVRASEGRYEPQITVSQRMNLGGTQWEEPSINWPGCGDKTEKQTDSFIRALSVATNICNELANGINPAEGQYRNYLK